jgi:hypothetical protein
MADDDQQPVAENKRATQRMRVLKGAKIVALNQWTLLDCTVRDISATGARIVCKDQMAVQKEFRFLVVADNTICNAKVAWRRGDEIGITFTSEKIRAPVRKI